ncbi:hypothetical protein ElyMa_003642300 [Elysia marginata]|uniref:Uncharacterized protein n=1 Tax=Elysia marginata TaxID=1093978 RepID=A0AAV4EX45_9GAST|nr:hypothetical protein ElyMa_003642300 [Elysia marginata]
MKVLAFFAFAAFCLCLGSAGLIPKHASCNLDWYVEPDCAEAGQRIVLQIKKWNNTACGTGEKCRYALTSFDGKTLKGKHTTPVKHYVDDISMMFKPSGTGCAIHGFSSSETWYAFLDQSTNYCNLHNLVSGSNLDKTPKFKETTSDAICTQYSSADCEKY